MNRLIRRVCTLIIVAMLLSLLAACGSGDDSDGRPTSTQVPRFAQVATSTESPDMATAIATEVADDDGDSETVINPTSVARGLRSWDNLECASCHGENGEGGADEINGTQAPSLLEMTLSEDEFIDWLRTGGTLGNDHLFSTDRLSNSGGKNLYQYILSLSGDQ